MSSPTGPCSSYGVSRPMPGGCATALAPEPPLIRQTCGYDQPMTWDAASKAVSAWADLVGAVRARAADNRLADARVAVASVLLPSNIKADRSLAAVGFAEQMTADVSALTADQRKAALSDLGPSALHFVQAVWVCDIGTRACGAFGQLFNASDLDDPMADGPSSGEDPWQAQQSFLWEVAKLTNLDPVTSELVRLRGARAHRCRLCQSLRSRTAVQAAGGVELFESEDHEHDELTERQRTALALVDAFIWQPMAWPEHLAGELRSLFSPAEVVELVVDVMRNSANKIAVALAADAPHVTEGVEYYDIDYSTGELSYGLPPA